MSDHDAPLDVDGLPAESLAWVEALYERFRTAPEQVGEGWRRTFEAWEADGGAGPARAGPGWERPPLFRARGAGGGTDRRQHAVDQLVRAYRVRGHRHAHLSPLDAPRPVLAELEPGWHGLGEADLDALVVADHVAGGARRPLREVLEHLQTTYCRTIGVQFMHIDELAPREWLIDRMESTRNRCTLAREEQLRILERLTHAATFESFLQTKYLGAKTFSLEGGETLVPLLDMLIDRASSAGIEDIVLGMSHRGRLNVLANILGKPPWRIFREFEDTDAEDWRGGGDVKYHLGNSADVVTASGHAVHISLCFNPSHLAFVAPVVCGRVRAKQDRLGDDERRRVLGVVVHGDAAFIGEGVVQETLNLGQLAAYRTGGTVHVLVNNQIGFTTEADQSRSTTYATDVAKMLQAPIFHVNGEDPEGVAQVVRLALAFRETFRRDVVIDMYCYRRHGHNEGDEPRFTQPLLYERIRRRRSVREGYLDHLLGLGEVTREEADRIDAACKEDLERHLAEARADDDVPFPDSMGGVWQGYRGGLEPEDDEPDTAVALPRLREASDRATRVPEGFVVFEKLERILAQRKAALAGEGALDWGAAETLALATLALEGVAIRLTGQDSERGTFSQRHAVWHDVKTGARHEPLAHLDPGQGRVEIANSPLSEAAALGYEYGYSLDRPGSLVLWEAQFGDFVNAAQVVIDQFLASAEDKWRRLNGLVLLLPHGYEGQGPEHSSARPERFLMLAAEHNLQLVQPSTAGQMFHLLRRQALRRWRKPLVVLTPKSLLRRPEASARPEDLAQGGWRRVIPDTQADPARTRRILVASGKVVHELRAARKDRQDVAVIALEQLYPLHRPSLKEALAPYAPDVPAIWVQDEPENMGAWRFLRARFGGRLFGHRFDWVARPASASPATGSHAAHAREQEDLLAAALGDLPRGGTA